MAAAFSRLPLPAGLMALALIIVASLCQLRTCVCNGIDRDRESDDVQYSVHQTNDEDSLVDQSLNISHPIGRPSNHHRKSRLSSQLSRQQHSDGQQPRPSDDHYVINVSHPRPSSIHRHRRLRDLKARRHPFPDPWVTGVVTWYGYPEGAGSDGGACGYKSTVSQPPFNSMIAAGSGAIYLSGKGCGACYKVKCKRKANKLCSGRSIKVVITDQAPEDATGLPHFDLSGTAFGALARPGHAAELRNAGIFQMQYKRVSCGFKTSVTFRVDDGSNPYYMAILVEFQNGKRDITKVELRENDSKDWKQMTHSWGAMYQYNSVTGQPINFPLSVRVTEATGDTIKAIDVIPNAWNCGTSYTNHRNF